MLKKTTINRLIKKRMPKGKEGAVTMVDDPEIINVNLKTAIAGRKVITGLDCEPQTDASMSNYSHEPQWMSVWCIKEDL